MGRWSQPPVEPGHHFELEHGSEPHCFGCRKAIEIDDLCLLYRMEDTIIWWHHACAPPDMRDADA